MADDIEWFLGRDGRQYGPIKNEEMRTLVRQGQILASDLVWHSGLPGWAPAGDVLGLVTDAAGGESPSAEQDDDGPAPPDEPAAAADTGPAVAETAPPAEAEAPAKAPAAMQAEAPRAHSDAPRRAAAIEPERGADTAQIAVDRALRAALAAPAAPAAVADVRPPERRRAPAAEPAMQQADPAPSSSAAIAPVREPVAAAEPAPASQPARRQSRSSRPGDPAHGAKRQRRLVIAALVPVAMIAFGMAVYVFWEDLVGGASAISPPPAAEVAKKADPVAPPSMAPVRPLGALAQAWQEVSGDFPDWYRERSREIDRLRKETKEETADAVVVKYVTESLVSLRRNHAGDALSASHERIRRIATAFVDNLDALQRHSVEACYDFISHGEASESVLQSIGSKPVGAAIDAHLTAIFQAIAEGQKRPVQHLPPNKSDYDRLADELVKIGWTDNDLKVFSDPRLLARAAPDQVCKLVRDWFRAHLALADQGAQLRLLAESLRPVVAG